MEPGVRIERRPPFAERGVVLAGHGTLFIVSERRALHAGDAFFVGPEVVHTFETPRTGGETIRLPADAPIRLDDPTGLRPRVTDTGFALYTG